MADKAFRLDMTMMFAVHAALRRELERIARITAKPDDDPRRVLGTAIGWEMFKEFLRVHHTSEDLTVWPVMQRALAERPDDLALLDAMEAEHGAIDPLLESIDAALADRESGPHGLGDLVERLRTGLAGHLDHEESDALPLMDAFMTEQEWIAFSEEQRNRIGGNAPRYLPWLLDDADPDSAASILGRIPDPLRAAYEGEWRAAYAALGLWTPREAPVIG